MSNSLSKKIAGQAANTRSAAFSLNCPPGETTVLAAGLRPGMADSLPRRAMTSRAVCGQPVAGPADRLADRSRRSASAGRSSRHATRSRALLGRHVILRLTGRGGGRIAADPPRAPCVLMHPNRR